MTGDQSAHPAGSYHAVHLTEDPARALVWQIVADHLARWIPPDAHVLEIGAGYCCWINAVKAKRRVAVDIWPEMPRHAAAGVEPLSLDLSSALPSLGPGLRALGDNTGGVSLARFCLAHAEKCIRTKLITGSRTNSGSW